MSTQTTASAGAAPVTPVTQPASAPVLESPTAATAPITVPAVTSVAPPTKTANDIVLASGEDLATRYGIANIDATEAAEAAAEAPAEPVVAAPPVAAAPPAADAPAESVPEPVAADAPVITAPITPFQFYDEQGELEIPANVKLDFKAGGKEYKGLRLDEVVRMAQQAPMAERHRQEAEALKPVAEQAQQALAAYQQTLAELQQNNAIYEQLLGNDQLYLEAASRYREQNTPEQRLARIEQQRQSETQQYQQQMQQMALQQTTAAAQQFTASRIAPRVDALTTQYPAIEAGDVLAKFHELTAPLLAPSPNGGVWVPPNRLAELESSVLPQLEAWTQARAAKSTASSHAATTQAKAQVQKAQLDAQLATRQLARPLTPLGNAPMPDVPKPKPIKTAGDAIEASIAKARAQIGLQ